MPSTSSKPDVYNYYGEMSVRYGSYSQQVRYDFGVPKTALLDSTAAKSKVEAVKQSTVKSFSVVFVYFYSKIDPWHRK